MRVPVLIVADPVLIGPTGIRSIAPRCPTLWFGDKKRTQPIASPKGWRLTELGGHIGNPGPSASEYEERE